MKVLLIDTDSKIPNLALMKISMWHKRKNDRINIIRLGRSAYKPQRIDHIEAHNHDSVYVSTLFLINRGKVKIHGCRDVHVGGTGENLKTVLPPWVDTGLPDYDIYPDNDISYGFVTRGCVRRCLFCVVPEKEGGLRFVRPVDDIVRHKKVRFLDNNILAYNDCKGILKEIVDKKIRCCFYQGLDIRFVTDEIAQFLSEIKYMGEYVFAFDSIDLLPLMNEKIKIVKRWIPQKWKIKMFIYCNEEMDIEKDVVARIAWCKANEILPYLMRDANCYSSDNRKYYTDLTRWCCQPQMFKKMTFDQFLKSNLRLK